MLEQYKIATVEGNCRSGKSTLVESLKKVHDFSVVGEYDEYVGGATEFPSFPPDTYLEAKASIDFFVGVEKRRSADAMEMYLKSGKPVVTDRSPFSCVVFQKYVHEHMPSVPNAYEYSMDAFQEGMQASDIIVPNAMIYLMPSLDTFMQRVDRFGRLYIDFLSDKETFLYLDNWYKTLIDKHFTDNSGIVIPSTDGSQIVNAEGAKNFLESANYLPNAITIFERVSDI